MSLAEKIAGGLIMIALATTLILPGRQTVPVLNAAFSGLNGAFKTTMGR